MSEIVTKDLIVASGAATTRDDAIREAGDLLLKAMDHAFSMLKGLQNTRLGLHTRFIECL